MRWRSTPHPRPLKSPVFSAPRRLASTRSETYGLERFLTPGQCRGVMNYWQRIREMGGNANEVINTWQHGDYPSAPELWLDETPGQKRVRSDQVPPFIRDASPWAYNGALQFGPGLLYHAVDSIEALISPPARGAFHASVSSHYFCRTVHTYAEPFLKGWRQRHPALLVYDTEWFNHRLRLGQAQIDGRWNYYCYDRSLFDDPAHFTAVESEDLPPIKGGPTWHPYPRLLLPPLLEEAREIWVWESTFGGLGERAGSAAGKLRAVPEGVPGHFTKAREPASLALLLYALERDLWMKIPALCRL